MSAASAGWTLCIDFGTAFSKAAAAPHDSWSRFDPAWVRPLALAGFEGGNAFLLPSAVFVADDAVLFGAAAFERAEAFARYGRMALRSFKTLLSVSDLDRALKTKAPTAIDPHRMFNMGDLIVLYLAFLSAAIARAKAADPELASEHFANRRYAAPAWRSGDSAGLHKSIVALFSEAEALAAEAGERLLAPEGIEIASVESLLSAARSAPRPLQMGLIFEASAAAAYTSIGLERSAAHMVVVDVGAGTTDIAAMFRSGGRIYELPQARATLKQAGEFIDRVIANLATEASGPQRSPQRQAALWNLLMRQMQDIKESLLYDGRALLRYGSRTLVLKLSDLERDRDFAEFRRNLQHAFDHSLAVACRHAHLEKRTDIQVIAVGGGSGAPFIQEMLRRARVDAKRFKVTARPATPDWAHAEEFSGNLAPVFPQLAIAIGGAIAPDLMLAAGGED